MTFCNACKKKAKEITVDASFDYAGTHCTHGLPGTHHEYYKASDCCEDDLNDGIFVQCKCGNEIEVSENTELEWLTCKLCKRTGNWLTEY